LGEVAIFAETCNGRGPRDNGLNLGLVAVAAGMVSSAGTGWWGDGGEEGGGRFDSKFSG